MEISLFRFLRVQDQIIADGDPGGVYALYDDNWVDDNGEPEVLIPLKTDVVPDSRTVTSVLADIPELRSVEPNQGAAYVNITTNW